MNFLQYFIKGFFLLTACVVVVLGAGLNEEFTWTRINFEWPREGEVNSERSFQAYKDRVGRSLNTPNEKEETSIMFEGDTNANEAQNNNNMDTGSIDYQYVNNIPMGANVWKDKLFISVPRRRYGVPSTLNYVPLNSIKKHNVPLKPYPNWDINLFPDKSDKGENLVSVYRVAIDVCDRMWVVDTGTLEIPGNRTFVRPQHQIVVIDLNNDQIIHRYTIPDSDITPQTTLASLTVDVTKENCGDAYVYLPDLAGFGVTVYSFRENHSWRVKHNYFYLESLKGEFFIAGHRFQWNDGIFSIELSDIRPDGFRDMYFHAMAGSHMFKVSTRIMRNETLATRSYHENDFEVVGDRGPQAQTATADIHKSTGTMFLGLINQNALGCWNIDNPLTSLSIVQRDDNKMIYPSDVKISEDKVYVLTNSMPGHLYGKLNYDQINFRVWSNNVIDAIQGTKCQNVISSEGLISNDGSVFAFNKWFLTLAFMQLWFLALMP